ncbi:MAG: hypothetical protein ACYC35_11380 [Pirellulales bacterium]
MKQVLVGVLFGLAGMSLACARKGDDPMEESIAPAPRVTREYLLAHGFKQSATDPDIYNREHVRLANIARDLGFSLKDLRPTVNQDSNSDVRTVEVGDLTFIVESEVRDNNGNIVSGSLDRPDAICTIGVSLPQLAGREYLKTDSVLRLHIKSVVMPKDKSKPWQVTFELAASGQKLVAIPRGDFTVGLSRKTPPPSAMVMYVLFPEKTPEVIAVSPRKPMVFTLDVPPDAIPEELRASGDYALQVVISRGKRQQQTVDYEWQGRGYSSDEYRFLVK